MAFHAHGGLHHRAVVQARQDKNDDTTTTRTVRRTTSTSTTPSTTTSTTTTPRSITATKDTPLAVTPSSSSVAPSSTSVSSSVRVSISSSANRGNVLSSTSTTTASSRSISPSASSVPAADSATSTSRKGSVAGVVIGILVAIVAIILIGFFVLKKTRKRRNRLDHARFFDNEKLERPGMVRGLASGPGVADSPPSSLNYPDMPASPFPSDAPPQMNRSMTHVNNPFSPVLPPASPFNPNEGQQELGAPPIPGNNSPALYGAYPSAYPHPNQTTPPGSPFAGADATQNPFATPSRRLSPPSNFASDAWPQPPMGVPAGAGHLPLLPGGAFGAGGYRDSGYSAACSEVHVGQAYKVQVGMSTPKYEDLTRETPPPPFAPLDPAATVNNGETGPTTVDKPLTTKALPPRPPSSQTVYSPDDAYGGM